MQKAYWKFRKISLDGRTTCITLEPRLIRLYVTQRRIHDTGDCDHDCMCGLYTRRPVASQPGGGGGPELGWVEHQAHPPPLGHCPRDVINLKNAHTLGHSQAPPPLGHCPCDVIHIFQGWNKIAKGWNKIAEGWNKIAKGWNKIAEGWNKIAKGWNKIAERWNKIAKGWNKIAKGWNKIFGMGNWGGGRTTPRPPPPWLRACTRVYRAVGTGPAERQTDDFKRL